ncbi:ProQ/FINO family protein [Silvimonas sp.]|uniref:ProQ/FINO family protein n=1 Tax=Silvimonas sp. TaxID=2650811 RepID=UPI002843711D|nr:ProQ/FINO family protein [Silvimonas sp.]MDR3429247.1 ProQ/FINO family protein [Silvimonas sp.]
MSSNSLSDALQKAIGTQSKRKQLEMINEEMYRRFAVLRENRPLAIGTLDVLVAALPHFDAVVVKRALSQHCARLTYQKQLARGGKRFNLKGKPDGEITDSEKQNAASIIQAAKPQQAAKAAAAKAAAAAPTPVADATGETPQE